MCLNAVHLCLAHQPQSTPLIFLSSGVPVKAEKIKVRLSVSAVRTRADSPQHPTPQFLATSKRKERDISVELEKRAYIIGGGNYKLGDVSGCIYLRQQRNSERDRLQVVFLLRGLSLHLLFLL